MLINYIKIAIKNLISHKVYSLINIMGLAIGMACAGHCTYDGKLSCS